MIVDYDGRILAQADAGAGEKIVVAPLDVGALRHARQTRSGHQMLAHLRTEAHPMYRMSMYPPGRLTGKDNHTVADNEAATDDVLRRIGYR
jgi:hypothetical protein